MTPMLPQKDWKNITQRFGVPSTHYKSGIHNGVDFGCPVGTPVYAPTEGVIYKTGKEHPSLGTYIYFTCAVKGTVYYIRVLHLSSTKIIGWYKAGEIIGYTGNTGDSSGPHLHIDVWNRPVDANLIRTKSGVHKYMVDPLLFIV